MDRVDELMTLIDQLADTAVLCDRDYCRFAEIGIDRKKIENALVAALTQKECVWKYDWDDQWETNCSHRFEFVDGTPTENKMKFCCYCGGKLVEECK